MGRKQLFMVVDREKPYPIILFHEIAFEKLCKNEQKMKEVKVKTRYSFILKNKNKGRLVKCLINSAIFLLFYDLLVLESIVDKTIEPLRISIFLLD